jgi:CheY-like chemotaxis protein
MSADSEATVDVVLMDLQFGSGMHGAQATAAITARPGTPGCWCWMRRT